MAVYFDQLNTDHYASESKRRPSGDTQSFNLGTVNDFSQSNDVLFGIAYIWDYQDDLSGVSVTSFSYGTESILPYYIGKKVGSDNRNVCFYFAYTNPVDASNDTVSISFSHQPSYAVASVIYVGDAWQGSYDYLTYSSSVFTDMVTVAPSATLDIVSQNVTTGGFLFQLSVSGDYTDPFENPSGGVNYDGINHGTANEIVSKEDNSANVARITMSVSWFENLVADTQTATFTASSKGSVFTYHGFEIKPLGWEGPPDWADRIGESIEPPCGYVGQVISSTINASHLEGQTVSILANGQVLDEQVVSGGTVNVASTFSNVFVGLPYYSDLETLEINTSLKDAPTILAIKKKIGNVTFYLDNTQGGEIGPNEDETYEVFSVGQMIESSGMNLGDYDLFSGKVRFPLGSQYGDGAKVFVRQSKPLPMTIGAIMPEVDIGGYAR